MSMIGVHLLKNTNTYILLIERVFCLPKSAVILLRWHPSLAPVEWNYIPPFESCMCVVVEVYNLEFLGLCLFFRTNNTILCYIKTIVSVSVTLSDLHRYQ